MGSLRNNIVWHGQNVRTRGQFSYSQGDARYDIFRGGTTADCSSFYKYCLLTGAGLNRGDYTGSIYDNGTPISEAQLNLGDAVFYVNSSTGIPKHVVLYIGNGKCLSIGDNNGILELNINYRDGNVNEHREYRSYVSNTLDSTYANVLKLNDVSLNSTGREVLLLQEILKAKGYYTDSLDGSFGGNTKYALRQYQLAKGYTPNGICDINMWNSLLNLIHADSNSLPTGYYYYYVLPCSLGSQGESVKLIQEVLKANSYYNGSIDGDFGNNTHNAVLSYQAAHASCGTPDGSVGFMTWRSLLHYINN